jgi:uncharacterized membrane protein
MHLLHTILEGAALLIDASASFIMVWSFAVAIYAFAQASFTGSAADRIMRLQVARCALGVKLVFALELLIISDLLHTVVSHSLDDLWFLAALVVIRTVISFFLNREIQEVEAEIQR